MPASALPQLLGIVGHPLAGNPTHFAMEQLLKQEDLDWQVLTFDVPPEQLGDAIRGTKALGFSGLSIAPPYGQQILYHVHTRSDTCRATGWADALVRDDQGHWHAHHLLADALVELLGPQRLVGASVGLFGNSPKALALGRALVPHGISRVWLRDAEPDAFRAGHRYFPTELSIETEPPDEPVDVLLRGSVCDVDAAEIDSDQPVPVDEEELDAMTEQGTLVDFAVKASTSPLLRLAAEQGLTCISAIDLLVQRAALASQLWTNLPPDTERLREAFEEYLEI